MLLGVVSVQCSVFSGKRRRSGDGNGFVHLPYAARERRSLRWWRRERRLGRRKGAGSGWYFSCCRRYEFCSFWYEFCSFLYEFVFFLHVLCCMFGNDPRYSAKKRVFGGRKTAILPGISPKTFEDKEMRTKNKFAEIRDVWTLPGGWACEQGRGRRDSSWGGRRKSDNKT